MVAMPCLQEIALTAHTFFGNLGAFYVRFLNEIFRIPPLAEEARLYI
jgi:hypothetical protein